MAQTDAAARRPLNILLISNHRRFKIHMRAYPWARELATMGHKVDVMCHADTDRWRTTIEEVDGFRIVHNPDLLVGALRQGWDPYCALRRWLFLRAEGKKYDVIHCLDTRLAVIWPALAYARRTRTAIVSDWIDWWGRGGLIAERRPGWYRLLFAGIETWFEEHYRNQLDGLTAISHALMERAVALGVPRDRCLWIPGGADAANFKAAISKEESRRQLSLPQDCKVLCFSGLDVLIDLPLAISAFEILAAERPDVRLLLVGPTLEIARRSVRDPANLERLLATGPVPYKKLPQYLAAADVFLMPYTNKVSNIGRWPNKVGDYMCMGRPVVTNPVGEPKWLCESNEIGLLCDETPQAMADAARRLMVDTALAERLGAHARVVAERDFSWATLVAGLEQWYYAITGRLRPAA